MILLGRAYISNESHTPPTPSLGAEVPQELFEHILWYTLRDLYLYAVPQAKSPPIQALTSIALVSTYFARLCRPWIYRHISLRNHYHLKGLITLLDSSHSRIGSPLLAYTKHVTITSNDVDDSFWVHHFPTIIVPKMQRLGIRDIPLVRLCVEVQLPGLGPGHNQAHWQLPRSLPPSLFRCVYALDLAKMHFERGEDLLRCLSMLPSVSTVNLVEMSCAAAPEAATGVHRPLSSRLRNISVSPSGPPDIVFETILPAMFTGCRGNFVPLLSHPSEPSVILDLLQLAEKNALFDKEWSWWPILRDSHSFTLRMFNHGLMDITLYPVSEENTYTHGDLRYDCIMYVRHNHADYPNAAILWQAMSDHIARLRFLNELDLEFDNLDIMDDFVYDMRPMLRSMRAAGHRIFLSERKDGTWYTVADALDKGVVYHPMKRQPNKAKGSQRSLTLVQGAEGSSTEP